MRRSESSLAKAQRIAYIGNWEYDVEKNEAYWSDEMYRIFGFAPQEFVSTYKTFSDSIPLTKGLSSDRREKFCTKESGTVSISE